MANLRDIKKEIKYVCGDLAAECMVAASFIKGADVKKLDELVFKIADLQNTALQNVKFSFDKDPYSYESGRAYHNARASYFKAAFKSFREKFYGHVNEIVHEMNGSLPKPAKEAKEELKA